MWLWVRVLVHVRHNAAGGSAATDLCVCLRTRVPACVMMSGLADTAGGPPPACRHQNDGRPEAVTGVLRPNPQPLNPLAFPGNAAAHPCLSTTAIAAKLSRSMAVHTAAVIASVVGTGTKAAACSILTTARTGSALKGAVLCTLPFGGDGEPSTGGRGGRGAGCRVEDC